MLDACCLDERDRGPEGPQIDHGAVTTLAPRQLGEFIAKKLKTHEGSITIETLNRNSVGRKLSSGPSLLKCSATHTARTYKVRGLDEVPANEARFVNGDGMEVDVAAYFQTQVRSGK